MKSKWCRIIISLMLLSINIEKRVHSLSYGFNHKLDNNLKLLQESLRWIRSPVANTRFRPWGGKRRARPEYSVISVPNYQIICQKTPYSLDLSLYSKCQQNAKEKNGLFRGFGKEEKQDGFDKENSLQNKIQDLYVEKGMPENANDGFTQSENKPLSLAVFMGNEEDSVEKRGQAFYPWAGKRPQTFYPWEGKRDHAFYPWAGKRDHAFYPWAGKRDHAFYPWAGKRAHSFYPWAGKRANQLGNYEENNDQGINETDSKNIHQSFSSQRRRRETTMDNTEDSNLVSKRMYVQYWRENTKRFGVLSDLLKKFETIKEGPNSRSFHPWAGKKRAENHIEMINSNKSVPNALINYPLIMYPDNEKQEQFGGENTSMKRKFYPWAGKRDST
ncbi:UNVERIFIED_CONTAM: hypothetical protein RMT77_005243 [Armadillidium vulgare]